MKKTFAYNSIIFGIIVAILVEAETESTPLAVVAFFAVAIGGFVLIRFVENAMDRGVDKAVNAASNAIKKRHENSNEEQSDKEA